MKKEIDYEELKNRFENNLAYLKSIMTNSERQNRKDVEEQTICRFKEFLEGSFSVLCAGERVDFVEVMMLLKNMIFENITKGLIPSLYDYAYLVGYHKGLGHHLNDEDDEENLECICLLCRIKTGQLKGGNA